MRKRPSIPLPVVRVRPDRDRELRSWDVEINSVVVGSFDIEPDAHWLAGRIRRALRSRPK